MSRLSRPLQIALVLPSLYFCGLLAFTVSQRVLYPAELELIEGSPVNHALRILDGLPLYIHPSFEFTPNLYTPLFYYLGAGVSLVNGISFASLRLVSIAATLMTILVCGVFVYRKTGSRTAAVTAGGMYAATYAASAAWMDMARVDALFVALLFWAIHVWCQARTSRNMMCASLLFVLAFYAKQTALLVILGCVSYAVLFERGVLARIFFPLVTMGMLVCSVVFVDIFTQHWFSYYVFIMPAGHPNNYIHSGDFWNHDILAVLPVAMGCVACVILETGLRRRFREAGLLSFLFVMMLIVSYLARINKGGYYNNLMPLHACIAIFTGLFVARASDIRSRFGFIVPILVVMAVLAQFWLLAYDPRHYIPGDEDWRRSRALIERLRAYDGNVYSQELGFIGYQAGKSNYAHKTTLDDIWLSSNRRGFGVDTDLPDTFEGRIAFIQDGMRRNNIVAAVVAGDPNRPMVDRIGNYHLVDYDPGARSVPDDLANRAWWYRPWPVSTYYERPAIGIYIRDDYAGQAGQ